MPLRQHQWWDKVEAKCFGRHAVSEPGSPKIDEHGGEGGEASSGDSVVPSSPVEAMVEGGSAREGVAVELLRIFRRMRSSSSPPPSIGGGGGGGGGSRDGRRAV